MLQNPNSPGSAPPDPVADGEGARCPLPRTPPRSQPFSPRFFLRVSGSNQFGNPIILMIDLKCIGLCEVRIFRFRRTEKMDSVMKGQMGAMPPPPRIFELEPPLLSLARRRNHSCCNRLSHESYTSDHVTLLAPIGHLLLRPNNN